MNFSPISDLIHCTNEMNVNIPQLADSLFERTTNTSWVVVFKSLITTHHLMVYGNEVRRSGLPAHYKFNIVVVVLSLTVFPSHSVLSSTWLQGIHCSTSVIFWTKVVYKVTIWLSWLSVLSHSSLTQNLVKKLFF